MQRCRPFLFLLFAFLLLWITIPQPVSAQEITSTPEPSIPAVAGTELPVTDPPALGGISFPGNGETISGVVEIKGTTSSAWGLSFSYADNPTGIFFPLAKSTDPVVEGTLATWDTSTITDGFYVLRLHVSAADALQDFKLNVRILNYAPVETATSEVTATTNPAAISTLMPVAEALAMATLTPAPSPTMSPPLPPNPAMLQPQEVTVNFGKGALSIAVLFVVSGLLLSVSRKIRS